MWNESVVEGSCVKADETTVITVVLKDPTFVYEGFQYAKGVLNNDGYQLFYHSYCYIIEVLREILGKKMSAKLRKDMDDVSEKTGISLEICRRCECECESECEN